MKPGDKNKKVLGTGELAKFLKVCALLNEAGAKYLIAGGVAANLHGIARGTRDIDLLIPKDKENTEKVLKALSQLTWGIAKELTPEEILSKPFTIIGDQPRVDLLLAAGKITFEKAYPQHEKDTIEDIPISFLALADLIQSKQTDRPRDLLEVEELKKLLELQKKASPK